MRSLDAIPAPCAFRGRARPARFQDGEVGGNGGAAIGRARRLSGICRWLSLHLLALEKQWRDLRQIAPPDRPTVVAFGDDQFVLDAALLEQLGEIAIGLDEEVVLAAADPDQLELR